MADFGALKLKDATGNIINPVMNEMAVLLRRIVKLLEASGTVDSANRQRIAVETMPTTTVTLGAVTSPATLGTSVALGGQGPTAGIPGIGTVVYQPVWEGPVDQRWRVMEDAHIAYQTGIRTHLSFS